MVAKMIGVDLKLEEINLFTGDHLKPEYLKMNPRHTIPVLKDGKLVLTESRAICTYLINKYAAKNDHMYPRDPAQRAMVDSLLQFDLGTLYMNLAGYYYPVYIKGAEKFDEAVLTALKDALTVLESYLGNDKFLMGAHPGVVDVCIGTTLTGLEVFGFDVKPYPKIQAYYQRFTAIPEYAVTQKQGVAGFRDFVVQADAKRAA